MCEDLGWGGGKEFRVLIWWRLDAGAATGRWGNSRAAARVWGQISEDGGVGTMK